VDTSNGRAPDRSQLPGRGNAKLDPMAARYARFVRGELTAAEQAEVDVVDGIAVRRDDHRRARAGG